MNTIHDLVNEILGGEHDDYLDAIQDAVHNRRRAVAQATASLVKVGDVVRTTNVKPKYLSGITGEVIRKNDKSFRIQPHQGDLAHIKAKGGTRYLDYDNTIDVPHTCVEPA